MQGMFTAGFQGGPAGAGGGGRMIQIAMQGRGLESADISKVVYLGPGEAKRISIILDNQPRAMMINTLYSKNIPGEISFTIQEIKKSSVRNKPAEGEEILPEMPVVKESHEIIVDNEDPGFFMSMAQGANRLRKLLGINSNNNQGYQTINLFMAPEYWQPVVQSTFYGEYIRSAVYTRAGTGERNVTWKGIIKEPGYYDVYAFIGKAGDRILVRGGRMAGSGPAGATPGAPPPPPVQEGQRRPAAENPYRDFHFKVYHDDGVEEISIDFDSAEPGWNKLGTYYLSPDTVKVEMTNRSEGRVVIADAVKWVIKEQ